MHGDKGVWEPSIISAQFYCVSKPFLKNKVLLIKIKPRGFCKAGLGLGRVKSSKVT
jgi:hypothetical protein